MLNISNMKIGQGQNKNQRGIASILVVMTLMTVLALISIGLSVLMNREVRQSLDRQLSTGAYYAAESGVNDARHYLDGGGAKLDGCQDWASTDTHFVQNGDISGDGKFKYSCVIINPKPKELQIPIAAGETKLIKLSGGSLAGLKRLYFSWQNSDAGGNTPQPLGLYGQLPQQTAVGANDTGLLRVGVYPLVSDCNDTDSKHGNRKNWFSQVLGGDTADAKIQCASRNYFMYPSAGSGAPPNCAYGVLSNSDGCVKYTSTGDDGGVVPGNCVYPTRKPDTNFSAQATPAYCNTVVDNLLPVSAGGASSYYLRLTAVYKPIRVYIQATDAASPANAFTISSAQAVVDVTGVGNDVLRRIQARAPLQPGFPPLNYGLQSMESICKLFRNDVPQPGIYNNPHLDGASAGPFNTDNNGTNCSWPIGSNEIDPGGTPGINLSPPPTAHISASPPDVDSGSGTTISWSSTDASYCIGTNFDTGNATSGSTGTGGLSSPTTFTVTCYGPSGQAQDSTTVGINSPPPPPPVCNDPSADNYGGPPPCQYPTTVRICIFGPGDFTDDPGIVSRCRALSGVLGQGCRHIDGTVTEGAC
jgi:hypothetical protein